MPTRQVLCTCRDCKQFWMYTDDQGVERPGRMLAPGRVVIHKQKEQYAALFKQTEGEGRDGSPLSPEATVLFATISDKSRPRFEESVAVRPRDTDVNAVSSMSLPRVFTAHVIVRYSRMSKTMIQAIPMKGSALSPLRALRRPQSSQRLVLLV